MEKRARNSQFIGEPHHRTEDKERGTCLHEICSTVWSKNMGIDKQTDGFQDAEIQFYMAGVR